MRFNFKKISALATSALMIGMTAGVAAAANYPAPFVAGGASDVAIVVGSAADAMDVIQASAINKDLQDRIGGVSTTAGPSVTGEAYALFTSSSKVYMNDTINSVKSIVTSTELPIVLKDSTFDGDVSADVTETIKLGSNSRVVYGQHPTTDDDPVIAVSLGTVATTSYIYNATVNFNQAVNFTSSDSIGESFNLFGRQYTVGAGSTTTNLYLYESSETVDLSIGGDDPSTATVTVGGTTYTVDLVSASDDSATIKVTDSTGASQSKTISEDSSKKVQGLDVAVNLADETTNYGLKAQITVGANKVKLTDDSEVRIGSDETVIDGTNVDITGGSGWNDTTSFVIQVAADDTDTDAIVEGGVFVDPVFGTFKIEFTSLNIPETSTKRETIEIKGSGSDKATVSFTNHKGNTDSFSWFYNVSTAELGDSGGDDINVVEMGQVNKSEYVVVGNEDEGYLLELKTVSNASSGYSDDQVEFQDVFSDTVYAVTITSEGSGTLTVGGKSYDVTYVDDRTAAGDEYVRLNYPDTTTAASQGVIFPTIETSKGAKLAFYQPTTIALTAWDGSNTVSRLYFPDGDGYTYVTFAYAGDQNITVADGYAVWNVSNEAGTLLGQLNATDSTANIQDATIGQLVYQIGGSGTANQTVIKLEDVGGTAINLPGIVLFEEKDDSSGALYNAIIVKMDDYVSSSEKAGVADVELTWGSDAYWDDVQLESDDDLYKSMDYWGAIVTTDRSDSDSYNAVISYPDEQVYPMLYIAEESATINPGEDGTPISPYNGVVVADNEVASQSGKNLIVVGGSCINTAATALIGGTGAVCGTDFTDSTGIGPGQFLIKGYATNSLTSKLALLVAGYNKADTVNAAKYLMTNTVDTTKAYKGTSSTSAEMMVDTE